MSCKYSINYSLVTIFTEAPVLLTQRSVVSAYEGSDVQLTCNLRANYLPVSEIAWFNNQGEGVQDTPKYMLLRTSGWANLTVRDTDETKDSGEYRCSTSNAVGGTEINVTLVVKSKKSFFLKLHFSVFLLLKWLNRGFIQFLCLWCKYEAAANTQLGFAY